MESQEKVVVSKRVFVDPNKVGVRLSSSPAANVDRVYSSNIEEDNNTIAYTKSYYDGSKDFRPRVPSAPPMDPLSQQISPSLSSPSPSSPSPSSPSPSSSPSPFSTFTLSPAYSSTKTPKLTPKSAQETVPKTYAPIPSNSSFLSASDKSFFHLLSQVGIVILAIIGLFLCVSFWNSGYSVNSYAVVQSSWKFNGKVSEWRVVRDEGWDMPIGAIIVSYDTRLHSHREVVDRVEMQCNDIVEHYDEVTYKQKCENVFKGYEEIYSHTEETCESDGQCQQKDIFYKGNAIYSEECKDRPVTTKQERTVVKCKNVEIMRNEPVFQKYYFYDVERWVHLKDVVFHSNYHLRETVGTLPQGQRYSEETWEYNLHTNDGLTHKVKKTDFEKFERTKNGKLIITSNPLGWKTIEFEAL